MASYGAGHRSAARAVAEALWAAQPDLRIETADYVDLVSPVFNRVTQSAYLLSVKYVPAGFGWFYRSTSRIPPRSRFQRYLNSLGRRRLLRLLRTTQPRVVVCTFPTQAGVISDLVRRGAVQVPTVTVITDNTVHSQWIHPFTDRYCVSAPQIAEGVAARGIPPARVHVTGIPVRPVFGRRYDRTGTLRGLGLSPHRPTILVMSGAFGMLTGVVAACRALCALPEAPQLVVVTGRDRHLAREVAAALADRPYPVRVLGFVEEIAPLMQAADLLITKAGGLTTAEALACRLPMIIFKPIPGQEKANTTFLTAQGAALAVEDADSLAAAVRRLLEEPEELSAMRTVCRRLGRPHAAAAVAKVVLELMARSLAEPSVAARPSGA